MNTFAFMIHPIDPQKDVSRKFPLLGKLPPGIIDYFSSYFPPVLLSHITGVRSEATGKEIDGWLVACPMTPRRLLQVSLPAAYRKMVQTGRLAERLGAHILGLGAFTSVVGDAGITVAKKLAIPVTTGNSYTVALAVEASLAAARRVDLDPERCVAAVVGAYGSTGRACARLLARSVPHLILIGRQRDRLEQVGQEIQALGPRVDLGQGMDLLPRADIVLAVTSSLEPIIGPEHLKEGAVVCDVARPRNVSRRVSERRDDVLVIEGGVVDVPGPADFHFDFGFPPGKAYACMAETMVLAMEGRFEDYTLGREITTDRVDEIAGLAAKHGFRLSGFRSFERVVPEEQIERVRRNVQRCHLRPVHSLP
ncbi:MAG: shikimate dehydrogenase [Anaerolineae bacterium]|jgi:predicted amino acid dehydrogenase|nr:shikimate dehydrogenase [Anaerolineae bacterium]MDX9833527.1 shikimate dehydrogenase [Anaerolineae bacterium]